MNETEYLRQHLALERAHLLEILQAVRRGSATVRPARPAAEYIDWAGGRLLRQLAAHCQALQTGPATGADTGMQLEQLSGAAAAVSDAPAGRLSDLPPEQLLALLAAWSAPLEAVAGSTLRISHWRQAAQLSADTILQERQLYTAARAAAGLS